MRPGTRFQKGAVRPAGHIFYIPPSERATDDPKNRPHFLVNRCDTGSDPLNVATLAHMSTKATEHTAYGSPLHEIAHSTALAYPHQAGNHVVATRLLPRDPERLVISARSAVDHVRSVRGAVLVAIGLGEGLASRDTGSVRGCLVRVRDQRTGIRYGCVVTCHVYSASRRYQVIVPIIDRVVYEHDGPQLLEPGRWSVIPTRQPWWNAVALRSPMLDTAGLVSLSEPWRRSRDSRWWLKGQINVLPAVIDAATLTAVEEKIVERLHQ
jgi:hypothetical protein